MNFVNIILNILLVSIPEESVIALVILFALGAYNYLTKENFIQNAIRIMAISVIPMAITSNILKFIIKLNDGYTLLLGVMLTAITIFILYNEFSIKVFGKILLVTALSFVAWMVSETITFIVTGYGLHISAEQFNKTPVLNFVIEIPARIIQFGILSYLIIKANEDIKINVSKLIMENKPLKYVIIVISGVIAIILSLFLKYIVIERRISSLSLDVQLFIVVALFSLIILLILVIWIVSMYIYTRAKNAIDYRKGGDFL